MAESKASARRAAVALRRGKVLQMRAEGASYDEIWAAFPDEYRSRSAAIQDVQRALMQTVAEPAAELRALEVARLEMLWIKVVDVLTRDHVMVSHGRVIYLREPECSHDKDDDDPRDAGEPLRDSGPIIAAARELRALSESRRKLLGLDAATVVQVISDDVLDAEIRQLTEDLKRAEAAKASGAEGTEAAEG